MYKNFALEMLGGGKNGRTMGQLTFRFLGDSFSRGHFFGVEETGQSDFAFFASGSIRI